MQRLSRIALVVCLPFFAACGNGTSGANRVDENGCSMMKDAWSGDKVSAASEGYSFSNGGAAASYRQNISEHMLIFESTGVASIAFEIAKACPNLKSVSITLTRDHVGRDYGRVRITSRELTALRALSSRSEANTAAIVKEIEKKTWDMLRNSNNGRQFLSSGR